MKHFTLINLTFALLLCIYAAPMVAAPIPTAKERGRLSVKMVNLSSAVDAYFDDLPKRPTDSDEIILEKATSHDPSLLAAEFKPYLLKVQYQNTFAVVLMCTKDGTQAIMEDAGCSARVDRQVTRNSPCEFTLIVNPGCKVEGADPL